MRLCNLKAECQPEVTQRPEQRHTSEADLLSEATYWDRALTSTWRRFESQLCFLTAFPGQVIQALLSSSDASLTRWGW